MLVSLWFSIRIIQKGHMLLKKPGGESCVTWLFTSSFPPKGGLPYFETHPNCPGAPFVRLQLRCPREASSGSWAWGPAAGVWVWSFAAGFLLGEGKALIGVHFILGSPILISTVSSWRSCQSSCVCSSLNWTCPVSERMLSMEQRSA